MLHKKDRSRVKEVWYCIEANKPIERSDIEKGYEVGKGEYVVVEDEELRKIAPPTAGDKTAKPYVLFMAALTDTKQNAIAKIAMHNREHIVPIRPANGGLVLHTLNHPDELHKANSGETPKAKYTAKELELAKSLVGQLTAPFKPHEFEDAYRENVERLIEQKRKGRKITTVRQPAQAPVVDLMEALKRSLKSGAAASGRPRKTEGRNKAA